MDKKPILTGKRIVKDRKSTGESVRTAEFPQIKEAVERAVQEYGETLKKLAKDD